MTLGLFGGTFDPIHNGHLKVANIVMSIFNLDQIMFVPAGMPYLKNDIDVSPSQHRYKMVELAIHSNKKFKVSDMEINRSGPSYTIDTVQNIERQGVKPVVIFGLDVINKMDRWHNSTKVLKECEIIVVSRPNESALILNDVIKTDENWLNIKHVEIDTPNISSTDIRNRIKQGKSIDCLVPQSIKSYIIKNQLYK